MRKRIQPYKNGACSSAIVVCITRWQKWVRTNSDNCFLWKEEELALFQTQLMLASSEFRQMTFNITWNLTTLCSTLPLSRVSGNSFGTSADEYNPRPHRFGVLFSEIFISENLP